jgi:hypothetical protein
MKTASHRVRTAVVAVLAALAMTIAPAVAANAEGPGSATITFTGAQLSEEEPFWYEDSFGTTESVAIVSGVVQLTDLALGEYTGYINENDVTEQVLFTFTLTAEQPHYETEIELVAKVLEPGSATITFTGAQLPDFSFLTYDGPDGDFGFAEVDSDGIAYLTDLALGDYSATLYATETTQAAAFSFTLTEAAPHYEAEIEVLAWPTGTASLSGTLVDEDGTPIEGAYVRISTLERTFPETTTGPDGTFAYTELPAGDYSISAFGDSHFARTMDLTIADGEVATVELILPRADASIAGRLVDGEGNPVGDTFLTATRVGGGDDSFAISDPDGGFLLERLGAGDWIVTAGGGPWAVSQRIVTLVSGENAYLGDWILEPRTTGAVYGWITFAPGDNSIEGICATLLTPDGEPVDGMTSTTGADGTFLFAEVAPGTYTVHFVDCDPDRVPPYASAYYGGGTTVAEATMFEVVAAQDVGLEKTVLYPDLSNPEPEVAPSAAKARDLGPTTHDVIAAPGAVVQGEEMTVQVGVEYAGQWVSVWFRSPTTDLGGWHIVADDGSVTVLVPERFPAGNHRLAVQDADDMVIGWTTVRVERSDA